jgi:oxazoline/thiazoline synthase
MSTSAIHNQPSGDFIPQWRPNLRVEVLAGTHLLLLSEDERSMIHAPRVAQVAQCIDGMLSVQEIVAQLQGKLPEKTVLAAIKRLFDHGHLRPSSVHPANMRAFWELMHSDGDAAQTRSAQMTVSIEALGGLTTTGLHQCLEASTIAVVPQGKFHIVLCDDYLRSELSEINERCRQAQQIMLLVKPHGTSALIGPLIHAQFGSCLSCLQYWLRLNHPIEAFIARQHERPCHLPLAQNAAAQQAVFGVVASSLATLHALQQDRIPLKNYLLELDLSSMSIHRHAVQPRPQCPACGQPQLMAQQAARFPGLQSRRKLLCQDGGFRKQDPNQTYEQYRHLISNVCGPVTYLQPMPRRHGGMRKVYVAGYLVCPQNLPNDNAFNKVCAGKGKTDEQARASALCETLERFSAVFQGDELCVRAKRCELDAPAIDFHALQNFSKWQYQNRDDINRHTQDPRQQIPLLMDDQTVIDWTPAWSLQDQQRYYVPLGYCYTETPASTGTDYGIHNPNGAAAGNCLEEAILQGLLELIERDATAIWWYNQVARPGIDLASFKDPWFDALQQEYAAMGWQLWVLDISHDLDIAVCVACVHQAQANRFVIGLGCHLNAHLAVQRALTEVNQLFEPDNPRLAPWDQSKLPDVGFLFPSGSHESSNADSMPSRGGQDLLEDIQFCADHLKEHDMQMLVVDKTRPDIGLAVVQVIVPGLRHIWPRMGVGRLYSVPVKLGWLNKPTNEAALNPVPLFL